MRGGSRVRGTGVRCGVPDERGGSGVRGTRVRCGVPDERGLGPG